MNKIYDAAIIGAGVFGSWIAYYLQRAGLSVALIDAYGAANSRASSGGESRIIRMGYGADEIYTRWSQRSLAVWREFLADSGRRELFHQTGVLLMEALQRARLPFEMMAYPGKKHGIRGRSARVHLFEMILAHLERYLA